jgi:hypothetical protein
MVKRKLIQLIGLTLMISMIVIPVHAQESTLYQKASEKLIVQPYFSNISIFQNGFDISSSGKASVNVYLTAQNIDSVKVDASLQQYKNGTWITIKSWMNFELGTNSGLSGTYYIAKGYFYRLVSNGIVYKSGVIVERTSFTSETEYY